MARKTNKARSAGGPRDNGYRKKDPSYCSNCGTQVTNAGKPAKDGKRYCKQSRCQAVKSARYRARAAALRPDRDAPATCRICDAPLTTRKWRAGDEIGRFCRKVTCRRARDTMRAEAQVDKVPGLLLQVEALEGALALLGDAVAADNDDVPIKSRMVCPRCGLTTALYGWIHLTSDGTVCHGTRDNMPKRKVHTLGMAGAWPFVREYLNPEQLRTLNG